ncbi:CD1871A family CXXC motif-containing protein [Peptoniphilus catoniae]|nr:CD1871A family CXXC motif-containing protein [Peptoniphilus catoniae]
MIKSKYIRASLFCLSIFFIAYGAYRGEADSVLSKAIRICLECIGIG